MFRRKPVPKPPPPPCPECGKPTALRGRFCRACGWDADVEARGEGHLDGVDVPEAMDEESYGDFLSDEGLAFTRPRTRRQWLLVWTTVLALVVASLGSTYLWGR